MDDLEVMLLLFLSMSLIVTERMDISFQKRLKATRQKTADKIRRVWQILQSPENNSAMQVLFISYELYYVKFQH